MRRHYLQAPTIPGPLSLYPPQLFQRQKRHERERCLSTKRYGTVSPRRYRENVSEEKDQSSRGGPHGELVEVEVAKDVLSERIELSCSSFKFV